jgi:hypothetical protein
MQRHSFLNLFLAIMTDHSLPLKTLESLLVRRLQVITDSDFRNRDAASHLGALREVSEAIDAEVKSLQGRIPARLNHFLSQASYQKALDFIRQSES